MDKRKAQEEEPLEKNNEDNNHTFKKPRITSSKSSLHPSISQELLMLGCRMEQSNTATSTSSTTTSTSSSSGSSEAAVTHIGDRQLPSPLVQWTSMEFPSTLFKSTKYNLHEVELRSGWALPSRYGGGSRPALEVGCAKESSSNSPVYLAIPIDCSDPTKPDGRDGPIEGDEKGVPLASFLLSLTGDEEEEEEEEEDEDEDPFSAFVSAIVSGEDLPSEDEDDEDHEGEGEGEEDEEYEFREEED